MERRECPDCGKVFESKWRSKVQERYDEHRGRANPCTRQKGEPWVQERQMRELEPVPGIEDVDATVVRLDDHIRFVHVISRSFDQMNSHGGAFACMPNIDRNQVHYVFEGQARQAPLQAFVDVWFLAVFMPKVAPWLRETWPRWGRFAGEVSQVTSSYAFGGGMREGHFRLLKRSDIYRKSSEAIKGHLTKGTRAARNELRMRIAQTNVCSE